MIGRSIVGKGFYGCLKYNLEDKRGLTDDQKAHLQILDGLQHMNRAEVLYYNMCYGDAAKLSRDMIEVAKGNRRVEKPVFHFILRLAPGDTLTKDQWIEIAQECAREFKVEGNQYVVMLHKDAPQEHIHIVANRVGFDRKVASDSKDFKRIAEVCRRMEQKYKLTQVQSPKAFLTKGQQEQPRLDWRKVKLRKDIGQAIHRNTTYAGFENTMKANGYEVIKGRGITFIDDKKVRTKGSDVGFSLSRIEKALGINAQLLPRIEELERYEKEADQLEEIPRGLTSTQKMIWLTAHKERKQSPVIDLLRKAVYQMANTLSELCYQLFRHEYVSNYVDPHFRLTVKRKKRKRYKL